MSRQFSIVLTVLGIAILWLAMPKLASDSQQLIRTRMLMGTVVEIRVLADNAEQFQSVVDQAFAEMARLEGLLSPQRPESEIAKLEQYLVAKRKKLENENFISRAPAEVVAKEREGLSELETRLDSARATLEEVKRMA